MKTEHDKRKRNDNKANSFINLSIFNTLPFAIGGKIFQTIYLLPTIYSPVNTPKV